MTSLTECLVPKSSSYYECKNRDCNTSRKC